MVILVSGGILFYFNNVLSYFRKQPVQLSFPQKYSYTRSMRGFDELWNTFFSHQPLSQFLNTQVLRFSLKSYKSLSYYSVIGFMKSLCLCRLWNVWEKWFVEASPQSFAILLCFMAASTHTIQFASWRATTSLRLRVNTKNGMPLSIAQYFS